MGTSGKGNKITYNVHVLREKKIIFKTWNPRVTFELVIGETPNMFRIIPYVDSERIDFKDHESLLGLFKLNVEIDVTLIDKFKNDILSKKATILGLGNVAMKHVSKIILENSPEKN